MPNAPGRQWDFPLGPGCVKENNGPWDTGLTITGLTGLRDYGINGITRFNRITGLRDYGITGLRDYRITRSTGLEDYGISGLQGTNFQHT